MLATIALMTLLQVPDTSRFTAEDVLARAVGEWSTVEAARQRTGAAEQRVRQAGALPNLSLSAMAENLGAATQTTGQEAWRGTEGQVLLGTSIALGGDRGALLRRTRAEASEAGARERVVVADILVQTIEAVARMIRDRAILSHASADAEGVTRLAENLRLQAEEGRASEGDAARLALARTSAWARVAQVGAQAAVSQAGLARLIGVDPSTTIHVTLPACSTDVPSMAEARPELDAADATVLTRQAMEAEARALAIPDLRPQVGWRRSAGFSALYVGLEIALPVFDRNGAAREATRLETRAAEIERTVLEARLEAERTAALRALAATESAGAGFDGAWAEALARTVEAAEARYELGEGTLTELLDGRRARLNALADFETWRAELTSWRVRVVRNSGQPITARTLCDTSLLSLIRDGSALPSGLEATR